MSVRTRLADVREVLTRPPQVHEGAPSGVWNTHADCYRFLAENCSEKTRTLETGLGVSTVLFAAWGTEHTCVVGSQQEVDACKDYLAARGWSQDRITFVMGSTADVLPGFTPPAPFDVFLIDACHGFPFPALDWFYGARWLKPGGLLVFDDMQIPAVAHTIGWFLDLDPRWEEVERNGRWAAYRRLSGDDLAEEWTEQLFLGDPR
jgi:predicted O-methyltransferase YrrM